MPNSGSPPITPQLQGPDEAGPHWREAKILETLLFIQREALQNGKATQEVLHEVALLKKDMAHLVETFGARVASVERQVAGVETRITGLENRGDLRITSVERDTSKRFTELESRLNKMDLVDAQRVGVATGVHWLWTLVGALMVFGMGAVTWIISLWPKAH